MKGIGSFLTVLFFVLALHDMHAQSIEALSGLNSVHTEYAPVFSSSGKQLVFQSNRVKGFKLYESYKTDSIWSAPQSIEVVNLYRAGDLTIIGSPYLSADGNTLFYSAWHNDTYGNLDIYYTVKKDNAWSKPEHISTAVNTAALETSPSLSQNADTLFFVRKVQSELLNTLCGKLFFSVKGADAKWTQASELTENQSCYNRVQQTYASGYFWTDVNNKTQLIQQASAEKGKEMNALLSSLDNLKTPWLTPKEDMLVYAANGNLAATALAYNTHVLGTSYVGKVLDVESKEVISEVQLFVQDSIDQVSFNTSNNATGEYSLYVPAAYVYKLRITADKYDTLFKTYTVEKGKPFSIISEDILLQHRKTVMVFRVSDQDNGKNLKVKVKLTNKRTGEELVLDENMQQDGKYTVHLREGDDYAVEVNNVEGYEFTKQTLKAGQENASIPVERIKQGASLELHDIYFAFNSFELSNSSFKELDDLVEWMKTNKKVMVRIEAHTDDVGSAEFNLNLSDKRAKEIVKYLSKRGIPVARTQAKGYGMTKPRAEGDSEEARAQNRRVELNVLTIQK
jgi:outer membrane protein OmpA-like peptidoglycan-associated protein